MRIQHNVTAMNSHRMYTINSSALGKNVEKLSSGYKINRAGDDAAGLAISEKMRGQIRGLTMASKNSQDAISLIQTAEGALQSTQDILQRMRELSVQAASDTNLNEVDREALDMEFQQLIQEIDQTADKTEFNKMKLIDGSFGKKMGISATVATAQSLSGMKLTGGFKVGDTITLGSFGSGSWELDSTKPGGISNTIGVATGSVTVVIGNPVETTAGTAAIPTFEVVLNAASFEAEGIYSGDKLLGMNYSASFDVKGTTYNISFNVMATGTGAANDSAGGVEIAVEKVEDAKIIQIGANKGDELEISIANMDAKSIGDYGAMKFDTETGALKSEIALENSVYSAKLTDRESSSSAIKVVDGALNMLSMQRAALGAKQNRLEFKIQNLDNSAENLQAAESRIRDTDMAKEMTSFVKNNILFQASTAMLAQANSLPQGVLQLLG